MTKEEYKEKQKMIDAEYLRTHKTNNMTHELKVWPEYFGFLRSGLKNFEVRWNDRKFQTGDELLLKEYDQYGDFYTGRIVHREISFILHGPQFGIEAGYVVLGLKTI